MNTVQTRKLSGDNRILKVKYTQKKDKRCDTRNPCKETHEKTGGIVWYTQKKSSQGANLKKVGEKTVDCDCNTGKEWYDVIYSNFLITIPRFHRCFNS